MNSSGEYDNNPMNGLDNTDEHGVLEGLSQDRPKGFLKDKPFLLFLIFLFVYTITLETSYTRDCMPNMYLPLSMIKHGSISLTFYPMLYAAERPYFLVPYHDGLHSIFGIGAPILALPFYIPFLFLESTPSFEIGRASCRERV